MRAIIRVGMLVWLVTFWASGVSEAQQATTKRQTLGAVTVDMTPIPPTGQGDPLKVKVVLDTHSVALDGIKFEEAVALRASDGTDIAPMGVEQASGSGHHREAVVIFTAPTRAGALTVIVKNVGGVAERSFTWELPAAR